MIYSRREGKRRRRRKRRRRSASARGEGIELRVRRCFLHFSTLSLLSHAASMHKRTNRDSVSISIPLLSLSLSPPDFLLLRFSPLYRRDGGGLINILPGLIGKFNNYNKDFLLFIFFSFLSFKWKDILDQTFMNLFEN